MCKGGTLFIDELDDLPIDVQPKLLRALDEREIVRVGSSKPIKLDLRVVAATKKDLRTEVAEGRFREDLYFRLSIVNLRLPPLRERVEMSRCSRRPSSSRASKLGRRSPALFASS